MSRLRRAGKQVTTGRKRHIVVVDTLGLILAAVVVHAANVRDREMERSCSSGGWWVGSPVWS